MTVENSEEIFWKFNGLPLKILTLEMEPERKQVLGVFSFQSRQISDFYFRRQQLVKFRNVGGEEDHLIPAGAKPLYKFGKK